MIISFGAHLRGSLIKKYFGLSWLLALSPFLAHAETWVITPEKGTIIPNKVFSNPQTVMYRGIDWGPWTALEAVQKPDVTPTAGKKFISPDQRFSAETEIPDNTCNVVIKDLKTGTVSRLPLAIFPVLALSWCPDSKTILAVVHESMTSTLIVFHWDGHGWDQFEVDPPESGDNAKYHVVEWVVDPQYIKATFIVDHGQSNELPRSLTRSTFHLDPLSGRVSNPTEAKITQEEYLSLRGYGN